MRRIDRPMLPLNGAVAGPPRPPPVHWVRGDSVWWLDPATRQQVAGVVLRRFLALGHPVLALRLADGRNIVVPAASVRLTGRDVR